MSRIWEPRDASLLQLICGPNHKNLLLLETELADGKLKAESQGGGIRLDGSADAVSTAEIALTAFEATLANNPEAGLPALEGAIEQARSPDQSYQTLTGLKVPIKPQTNAQAKYLDLLTGSANDLIFGVGPAGTGKTFLAVAAGAAALKNKSAAKLIITRPAVEAGENLGFLPGDLEEKVEPYLRPIWDALDETLGADQAGRLREKRVIEVAPLAFMRGRTLKNAFVIMDEAQNATIAQMKMVLTRLGRDSRMVVTGDPGQVDLPRSQPSGLAHALKILRGVDGVGRVTFSANDVRRHALVSRIIMAYDKDAEHRRDD
ncbi:MAG: PhoH family protein [Pseudomonadota bacterium]|nr:PhoH family protein [Pseudomonadota bacterium]